MHDEALVSLKGQIDQMSSGIKWLEENFGVRPNIGYQIDPFGHSSFTPLLYHHLDYKYAVVNRIDYRVKNAFAEEGKKLFLWKGQESHPDESYITTHMLAHTYSNDAEHLKRIDSMSSHAATTLADSVIAEMEAQSLMYPDSGHLLLLWGDDFRFKNAPSAFNPMDALLERLKKTNTRFDFKYCTLSEYFEAVSENLPKKEMAKYSDDFLPYISEIFDFWTGFYSTRPALKMFARDVESDIYSSEISHATLALNLLNSGKSLDKHRKEASKVIEQVKNEISVLNHHDAITGTCAAVAAKQYEKIYDDGKEELSLLVGELFSINKENVIKAKMDSHKYYLHKSLTQEPIYLTLFNPLAFERVESVNVEILGAENIRLQDSSSGKDIPFQKVSLGGESSSSSITFSVSVPALGVTTLVVTRKEKDTENTEVNIGVTANPKISNDRFEVVANDNGVEIRDLETDISLSQTFRTYYTSKRFCSGAYSFRTYPRLEFWISYGQGIGYGMPGLLFLWIVYTCVKFPKSKCPKIRFSSIPHILKNHQKEIVTGIFLSMLLGVIAFGVLRFFNFEYTEEIWYGYYFGIAMATCFFLTRKKFMFGVILLLLFPTFFVSHLALPDLHSYPLDHANVVPTTFVIHGKLQDELIQIWGDADSTNSSYVEQHVILKKTQNGEFPQDTIEMFEVVRTQPDTQLVSRFKYSGLGSPRLFTDNSFHLIEQYPYSFLETPPGNYHPVINQAVLKSGKGDHTKEVSWTTTQSLGVGNLPDSLEFMLARDLRRDDGKGLRTLVADQHLHTIPMTLSFDTSSDSTRREKLKFRKNNPLVLLQSKNEISASSSFKFSPKKFPNIYLQTMNVETIDNRSLTLLMRLHLMDPTSDQKEKFTFGPLFKDNFGLDRLQVTKILQTDLSGQTQKATLTEDTTVEIGPYQILTFLIELSHK
eukprot:TRINITY_DN1622_c0_g1_i4.p1 TRINITY_DN1622_c0_g1~~TRINITY_DN1622_c0_g1_i4.p1  ORF type:complete len:934 (-),score=132.19 TRINITY_DN1622_c0_g1_i4:8-2809(-)